MWDRAELKDRAKSVFQTCRWPAVGVSLVYTAVSGGSSGGGSASGRNTAFSDGDTVSNNVDMGMIVTFLMAFLAVVLIAIVIGIIFTAFVANPIEIGTRRFFMMARQGEVNFREIVHPFSNAYIQNVVTMFLRNIFVFLWSLLFFIPGIIKSYEYRMIPYILAENPDIERKDAFRLSKEMMAGQKWDTFILDLSFFPWALLTVVTCGIVGIFYYLPYYNCTCAELYSVLRSDLLARDPKAGVLLTGFGMEQQGNSQNFYQQDLSGQENSWQDNYNSPEVSTDNEFNLKYTVELRDVGKYRESVIKAICEVTGLTIQEAAKLADNVPSVVKKAVSRDEAEGIKVKLEAAGAVITIFTEY